MAAVDVDGASGVGDGEECDGSVDWVVGDGGGEAAHVGVDDSADLLAAVGAVVAAGFRCRWVESWEGCEGGHFVCPVRGIGACPLCRAERTRTGPSGMPRRFLSAACPDRLMWL